MIDDYFEFNGISSKDFHIHVEKFPVMRVPRRRMREEIIPGRNGVLHIDEGSYEPFIQPYEIYFHDSARPAPELKHEILGWLFGGGTVCRLEDSYDLDHFRLATYRGPGSIENIWNRYGRCVIGFECRPEAFLTSGEQVTTISHSGGSIVNPTAYDAKPLIKVFGSGTGTLTVAGTQVQIKTAINQHLYLDCEMMEAYRQAGAMENKNGDIYAPTYPVLRPGSNAISWTGSISKVEITPRWWEL